ncbi:MAG: hypothetical protein FJX77_07675 [Armatimonadetes bacterium]|nr:hypothetical protein [Armatimonadota bacterium]
MFQAELSPGVVVTVTNAGEQTQISLVGSAPGQQQAQQTGFTSGRWSAPPRLFRYGSGFALRLTAPKGPAVVEISARGIEGLTWIPELSGEIPMSEKPDPPTGVGFRHWEPLPPLAPLPGLAPMEMRMGGGMVMQMGVGAGEVSLGDARPPAAPTSDPAAPAAEKRFCTACGRARASEDRFCGGCGARL